MYENYDKINVIHIASCIYRRLKNSYLLLQKTRTFSFLIELDFLSFPFIVNSETADVRNM